MPAQFDHEVIVVGGGAMGAATAWHLARDGRDVLLLEQFEAATATARATARRASSAWPTATPLYTELALAALPWWRTLEDESGAALLDQCGQIDHGDPTALDDVAASLEHHHRPHERLSTAEARSRWPGLRTEHGVVLSPDGGLRPRRPDRRGAPPPGRRARAPRSTPTSGSVRIEGIGTAGDGGVEVVTEHARHSASVVVVAAGAWLAGLIDGSAGSRRWGSLR